MVAAIEYLADIAVGVDRSIRVRRLPELLAYQPGLGGRTGRRAVAVTRQQGEDSPHGARFERDDHLGARLAAHAVDDRKIPRQQNFEDNINELVDQVEDYTRKDRMRKEREVEEAFASDKEPKR